MIALLVAAYIATIPAANWLIGNVGACIPGGPCLVPVAPGLMAPSGVFMVGVALVLRDLVQDRLGTRGALAAVAFGVLVSWLVADPMIALASGAAFLLSELADMAVYTPLRARRMLTAVFVSGVVGSMVDSAVFLWLAFGSFDFIAGQVVGKIEMTLAAVALLAGWRSKRYRK